MKVGVRVQGLRERVAAVAVARLRARVVERRRKDVTAPSASLALGSGLAVAPEQVRGSLGRNDGVGGMAVERNEFAR